MLDVRCLLLNSYPFTVLQRPFLILANARGSNGYRPRARKYELQRKLCDPFGLCVTVCHYPPSASKWNPIEYRLFSAISNNWKGVPLNSYETILKYLRKTKTIPKKGPGLKVKATLVRKRYKNGQKVSDKEMSQLQLENHGTLKTPRLIGSAQPKMPG